MFNSKVILGSYYKITHFKLVEITERINTLNFGPVVRWFNEVSDF
ncbi:hypothetical protein KCTC52924_01987 [Arenibacter antarcticus]